MLIAIDFGKCIYSARFTNSSATEQNTMVTQNQLPATSNSLIVTNNTHPIKLKTYIEADFRKYGVPALKVEACHKGGTWQQVVFLTYSPSVFNIAPNEPNQAE